MDERKIREREWWRREGMCKEEEWRKGNYRGGKKLKGSKWREMRRRKTCGGEEMKIRGKVKWRRGETWRNGGKRKIKRKEKWRRGGMWRKEMWTSGGKSTEKTRKCGGERWRKGGKVEEKENGGNLSEGINYERENAI